MITRLLLMMEEQSWWRGEEKFKSLSRRTSHFEEDDVVLDPRCGIGVRMGWDGKEDEGGVFVDH